MISTSVKIHYTALIEDNVEIGDYVSNGPFCIIKSGVYTPRL